MFDMDAVGIGSNSEAASTRPESLNAAAACNWTAVDLAELAALLGVALDLPANTADVEFTVRRLHPGETLCRAGDEFESLYVVRSGCLKTVSFDDAGNEQVLAFPMRGDAIGVDGFDRGHHTEDAIALESCHVIIVPFARIAALARNIPNVERLVYAIFNRELVHRQNMVRLLGMLNAEARVAAFLLDLSDRFGRLGCSKSAFVLRMTRYELGGYLGIKLETVSRALSAFAACGLINVDRREVVLNDMLQLRGKLASPAPKSGSLRVDRQTAAGSRRLAGPAASQTSIARMAA